MGAEANALPSVVFSDKMAEGSMLLATHSIEIRTTLKLKPSELETQ